MMEATQNPTAGWVFVGFAWFEARICLASNPKTTRRKAKGRRQSGFLLFDF
jgi:hypothetical protein